MISILTPSRSRPILAERMMSSALATAGITIDIHFWLNQDDPELTQYQSFLTPNQYTVGANQSTSYSWNLMAEQATSDILFLVGDDARFVTNNWALKVIGAFEQYPDRIVCVYPRVPSLGRKKNPHFCLHRNWIKALGFFLPPHFYHWYVDTWIREVAQRIDRFHCIENFELPVENVRDHVHYAYHRSWLRERDDWMWHKTQRYREADAATLVQYIANYKRDHSDSPR